MAAELRFVFAVLAIATLFVAPAEADATAQPYLDIPISQSVNRDGVIRYAILIKIGERWVKAMIDTGSTGLRVLPPVLPGDFQGARSQIAFGAGIQMEGLAVTAPIEIGSVIGTAPVEIVASISCVHDKPNCDFKNLSGDSYLIGGDGHASEGYSAILGIGFPFRGTDIGNPLTALGVKRWIVELPRPFEAAEGHLILEPDATATNGFTMLARNGMADASGCIQGGPMPEKKCGTVLFDTGAPAISVSFEGVETASNWTEGTTGILSFNPTGKTGNDSAFELEFHGGKSEGVLSVSTMPPEPHDPPEPFILAGIYPFYTYDILYDATARAVGLRAREPMTALAAPDAVGTTQNVQLDP